MEGVDTIAHQRRVWKFERIGWGAMGLVLLAGLLGLFGGGPLSHKVQGNAEFRVEYQRFERNHSPTIIKAQVGPHGVKEGKIRLVLSQELLEKIRINHVDPEPESVEAQGKNFIYEFKAKAEAAPSAIIFHFEMNTLGKVEGSIGLEEGPAYRLKQFVFP